MPLGQLLMGRDGTVPPTPPPPVTYRAAPAELIHPQLPPINIYAAFTDAVLGSRATVMNETGAVSLHLELAF